MQAETTTATVKSITPAGIRGNIAIYFVAFGIAQTAEIDTFAVFALIVVFIVYHI